MRTTKVVGRRTVIEVADKMIPIFLTCDTIRLGFGTTTIDGICSSRYLNLVGFCRGRVEGERIISFRANQFVAVHLHRNKLVDIILHSEVYSASRVIEFAVVINTR